MVGTFADLSDGLAELLENEYPDIEFKPTDRILIAEYGSVYDGNIYLLSEELRLRRKDWDNDFTDGEIQEMIESKHLRLLANRFGPKVAKASGFDVLGETDSMFIPGQSMEGYWE